ncbi:MAG: hypothetical protein R3C05_05520 [Pirellulaceae bacterium]
MIVNSSQGGGSKDTWVVSGGGVIPSQIQSQSQSQSQSSTDSGQQQSQT